jgi:hypothetical protein
MLRAAEPISCGGIMTIFMGNIPPDLGIVHKMAPADVEPNQAVAD